MYDKIRRIINSFPVLRYIALNAYDIFSLLVYGNMRRSHYVKDDERKCVYLVNPKVACSSIKQSFISYSSDNENDIHFEIEKRGLVHWGATIDKMQDYFVFTVVRNPFARLVSCYNYRYKKDIIINNRIVKEYDAYLFGFLKKDRGFKTFAKKVAKINDRISDQAFKSQLSLIGGEKMVERIDCIVHFEKIDSFSEVIDKTGLSNLEVINSTNNTNWMDYYDREIAEIVYQRYINDCSLLGYTEAYKELIEYLELRDNT